MRKYTYLNGTKVTIPKLDESKTENYIKVNLADIIGTDEEEGLWAVVDDETLTKHNNNEVGQSLAMLLNDSMHYPGLNRGTIVPIELRGERRSFVPFPELLALYNRIPTSAKDEARRSWMEQWKHM